MPATATSLNPPKLLALWLALLVALAPFALDCYLPAIPTIAKAFGEPVAYVQSSLSTYLLGFVIGQFIAGPIADQRGRKIVAALGLMLFAVASLAITQSTNAMELGAWRFVQALGGGAVAVVPAAIIRDHYDGVKAAKVFALVALITMAAPLVAPLIGASLLSAFHWSAIFIFLAAYALIVCLIFSLNVPETQTEHKQALQWGQALRGYKKVLSHIEGRRFIFLQAGSFSLMLTFITGSPFVYMSYFEVSPELYSILFGCNIVVMIAANRCNAFMLNHMQPFTILKWGAAIQFVAVIGLVLLALSSSSLWLMVPLNAIAVGMMGLVGSNSTMGALSHFKPIAGTATALMGILNYGAGGFAGLLLSAVKPETALPMAVVMCCCSAVAFYYSRKV
ncbi:multidrug effflux MFS transporter [Oceanicoccus sagamiensis]|uniref:Bcr/CflA family efflux transporter n=1 Tax=Oceanicoccus sagamiensis TaxID=716816 RepID=A0A1X9NDL1_9GAMM|nr:multidrug effflux MFS transporter [Oceanicoccus sagamiensis]ARN75144.1 hypothetical protein BST96_14085 [Oceanicoccus sagamiensis]